MKKGSKDGRTFLDLWVMEMHMKLIIYSILITIPTGVEALAGVLELCAFGPSLW